MKPRIAQLMTGALIAVGGLAACRKEVPPPPLPTPDKAPKPTVQTGYAPASTVALRLGR
ncbi:hypothetical protein [Roseateles sp.]|uniref:hypothetical protein n=1 Tax=Roseateles sp. TaxID=1971397 RepID=UPI003263FD2B